MPPADLTCHYLDTALTSWTCSGPTVSQAPVQPLRVVQTIHTLTGTEAVLYTLLTLVLLLLAMRIGQRSNR